MHDLHVHIILLFMRSLNGEKYAILEYFKRKWTCLNNFRYRPLFTIQKMVMCCNTIWDMF